AVMRLDALLPLIRKNIMPKSHGRLKNGLICLKGGDIDSEIPNNASVMDIDITDFFNEPHFQEKKLIYVPMTR
ncbi:MAG: 16S rRNA (guanine(527)-N(7))-methyltransferase RsmG, partial [Muribaculaceae bacterium]|nr:16S rRNA (guanine(527)-N(7))-methyltransferase RsmG [Muribaculaceae bacterium]